MEFDELHVFHKIVLVFLEMGQKIMMIVLLNNNVYKYFQNNYIQ